MFSSSITFPENARSDWQFTSFKKTKTNNNKAKYDVVAKGDVETVWLDDNQCPFI